MNQKVARKTRQEARRMYRESMEEIAEFHGRIIKAAPRWIPAKVWVSALSVFVIIKGRKTTYWPVAIFIFVILLVGILIGKFVW